MKQRLNVLALALVAALGATPAGRAGAATTYTVVDLGTLGGDSSEAAGINRAAQIVGWSTGPRSSRVAPKKTK